MGNHDTEPGGLDKGQLDVNSLCWQIQRLEDLGHKDCKRTLVSPEEGAVVVAEVEIADEQCCQSKKLPKVGQGPVLLRKEAFVTAEQGLLQIVEDVLAVSSKDVEEEREGDVVRLDWRSPLSPPDPEVLLKHLGEEVKEKEGSQKTFFLLLLLRVLVLGLKGSLLNLLHDLFQEEPAGVDILAVGQVKLLEQHLTLKLSEGGQDEDEPGVSVLGASSEVEEEEGVEVGVSGRHHRVVGLLEQQGPHHNVQHLTRRERSGGGLGAESLDGRDRAALALPLHHCELLLCSGEAGQRAVPEVADLDVDIDPQDFAKLWLKM